MNLYLRLFVTLKEPPELDFIQMSSKGVKKNPSLPILLGSQFHSSYKTVDRPLHAPEGSPVQARPGFSDTPREACGQVQPGEEPGRLATGHLSSLSRAGPSSQVRGAAGRDDG